MEKVEYLSASLPQVLVFLFLFSVILCSEPLLAGGVWRADPTLKIPRGGSRTKIGFRMPLLGVDEVRKMLLPLWYRV